MLHLSGGEKFDYESRNDVSQSYSSLLRSIQLSSRTSNNNLDAIIVILRLLESAQHHLLSTGCYETAIFTDSMLSIVLWIASLLYLAHASVFYFLETTHIRQSSLIASHTSLSISLWLYFLHRNIKQPEQGWKTCPSCIAK